MAILLRDSSRICFARLVFNCAWFIEYWKRAAVSPCGDHRDHHRVVRLGDYFERPFAAVSLS